MINKNVDTLNLCVLPRISGLAYTHLCRRHTPKLRSSPLPLPQFGFQRQTASWRIIADSQPNFCTRNQVWSRLQSISCLRNPIRMIFSWHCLFTSNRQPICRLLPMVSRSRARHPVCHNTKQFLAPSCPACTLSRSAVFAQLRVLREALCRASLWLFQVYNQPGQNPVQESYRWIRTCNPHVHSYQLRMSPYSRGLWGVHSPRRALVLCLKLQEGLVPGAFVLPSIYIIEENLNDGELLEKYFFILHTANLLYESQDFFHPGIRSKIFFHRL